MTTSRRRLPVAVTGLLLVLAVSVTPAAATEAGDGDGCQGLTTALSKVKNERARSAIEANLDARGCRDDVQTAQSACESLQGRFTDKPLALGSNLPGIVDWSCFFRPTADLSVESGTVFLRSFCASGNANNTGQTSDDGPTVVQCFL